MEDESRAGAARLGNAASSPCPAPRQGRGRNRRAVPGRGGRGNAGDGGQPACSAASQEASAWLGMFRRSLVGEVAHGQSLDPAPASGPCGGRRSNQGRAGNAAAAAASSQAATSGGTGRCPDSQRRISRVGAEHVGPALQQQANPPPPFAAAMRGHCSQRNARATPSVAPTSPPLDLVAHRSSLRAGRMVPSTFALQNNLHRIPPAVTKRSTATASEHGYARGAARQRSQAPPRTPAPQWCRH